MTTHTEITHKHHRRAVRFFWGLLIGATSVSLVGNIAYAVLPYVPWIAIQVGAATVPPTALLAAVHGIALAVRAGASGRVYCWAVSAVAAIGVGAFTLSFLALRNLMQAIGYSAATAWVFPAIVDTTVAVSTLMLVALGDKPIRRHRSPVAPTNAHVYRTAQLHQPPTRGAKAQLRGSESEKTVWAQADTAPSAPGPIQSEADADHASVASELISCGVTTQPVEIVVAVLGASRDEASINAAAKASGINYRTAQRIVQAAADHQQRRLAAVS
jgi:Protein of unknown function (DUF2637)